MFVEVNNIKYHVVSTKPMNGLFESGSDMIRHAFDYDAVLNDGNVYYFCHVVQDTKFEEIVTEDITDVTPVGK